MAQPILMSPKPSSASCLRRVDDDDDEPFALGSDLTAGLAGIAGGEHARLGMEADRKRRFRAKVEAWASKRGLSLVEGALVATTEDATISIALFELTEETAVVRGAAIAPAPVSMNAEPMARSWVADLRARFRKKSATTGDAAFDQSFYVRTSDEAALQQLLGEDVRAGLLAMDAWCSVAYAEGRIELRLDSPRLAGAHLLRAIDVAAKLARCRVQTTAYR
jgi:hypothetical protein